MSSGRQQSDQWSPLTRHRCRITQADIRVNSHTIKEVLDLHRFFRAYRSHGGIGCMYRGQADTTWSLIPKAGRAEYNNGRDLGRFNEWRRRACAYGPLPENDWECLALAQHYGLATRLLDWTLNPLVATFFAVVEHADRDGVVYCYTADGFINIDQNPLTYTEDVACLMPRAIDARMNRQEGVFTVHPRPDVPIQSKELEPPMSGPNLKAIVIPAALKLETRTMLADYGVHFAGAFPDLDGLSRHINWETAKSVTYARDKANRQDAKY